MRRFFPFTFMIIPAFLLVACSMRGISAPATTDTPSPSTIPSSPQSIGIASTETQATPTGEPSLQEEIVLPVATMTETADTTPVAVLRQLTSGGCCVQPTWSADGSLVVYIDRPGEQASPGLWGVDIRGGEPQFITDRLGIYSPDMQLLATLVNGATVVENLVTGEQWTIPNDGRAVSFSPDGNWLAWTAGQSGPPFDSARRQVWVSRFDGNQAREVFSTEGGGFAGWFPDGRLLVSGRLEDAEHEQAYWALSLEQSQEHQQDRLELARGSRLREAAISKDGSWLAYMVTFSQDPSQDGLWLVDTHSGERRKLDVFGSYQWRDGERLLVVPLDMSQPTHRLLQVQAATGELQPLTDPAVTLFKIANGDWNVSPDGSRIVFNAAQDGNIWVLDLPEQP